MAEPKATPPPSPIPAEVAVVFIKNPTGTIHDVDEKDPRNGPAIEQAKKSHNGWSLASDEEITEYCKVNNLEAPIKASKKAAAKE